jgi:hypothetical protein
MTQIRAAWHLTILLEFCGCALHLAYKRLQNPLFNGRLHAPSAVIIGVIILNQIKGDHSEEEIYRSRR